MTEVKLTDTERRREAECRMTGFDSMLSRFNRAVHNSGILRELKVREFYEKPSIKRRRKIYQKRLKQRKKENKDAVYKARR